MLGAHVDLTMTSKQEGTDLFAAFREDHAVLGRGFFELAQSLRANDLEQARAAAVRLDRAAGAHIAFEEESFYPALRAFFDAGETQRMYDEHRLGLGVVQTLCELQQSDLAEDQRRQLLRDAEVMAQHIADCGALFETMGRLPSEQQSALFHELQDWRRRNPRWTQYGSRLEPRQEGRQRP